MSETRIYIIRHGERCDSIGKEFITLCFDQDGNYKSSNLNLPIELPERADGYQGFIHDPPLSEVGKFTASLLGRGYKRKGIKIDKVYSSPSLRCVQTAHGFLTGYGGDYPLTIEPGLFEYMGFVVYRNGHPGWMTEDDFRRMGINVSPNENKIFDESQITPETVAQYYDRSAQVMRKLLDRHPGENILCFAHSTSHDACFRLISGGQYRTKEEFTHILAHTQFLCNIEIISRLDGTITSNGTPVEPMTVSAMKPYFDELHTMTDSELQSDMETKDIARFVKHL